MTEEIQYSKILTDRLRFDGKVEALVGEANLYAVVRGRHMSQQLQKPQWTMILEFQRARNRLRFDLDPDLSVSVIERHESRIYSPPFGANMNAPSVASWWFSTELSKPEFAAGCPSFFCSI